MNKPEALLTTPAENTECPRCGAQGVRYPGDEVGQTYAHCPDCGTTDLLDDRSPFLVLIEAHDAWQAVVVSDESSALQKMGRYDTFRRVLAYAAIADPDHCGECSSLKAQAFRVIFEAKV